MKNKFVFSVFLSVLLCSGSVFARDKEEEAFYVAEKAFSDNFYEASATLFEKFIRDFPVSGKILPARLYLIKSLFYQKKYPEAMSLLNELKDMNKAGPYLDQVYYWLGQVYFEGKNYTQALDYARKVAARFPDSPLFLWSKYLAGECCFSLSRFEESIVYLKTAVSESNDRELKEKALLKLFNVYYSGEEFLRLIELADEFIGGVSGEVKSKILLYRGEGHFGLNAPDKALKFLEEGLALTEDEELKNVFYQRIGDCLLRNGQEVKAKQSFDRISSEDLKQFSYANYYLKIKNYNTVLSIAEDYLENFSSSRYAPNMMLNRADSLYEMGRINDALFSYKKILNTLESRDFKTILDKAHYGLAWCYLKVGEFKKAIDEFRKTLKFTDNPVVRISSQIQIADAYQEKEMFDLALETYNRILKDYPDNFYADYIQFQIGMVFLRNNRLNEAKLSFRSLGKNFPSSNLVPQAEYYLAASYFSEGEYDKTREILELFLEKFPRHSLVERVRYLYGKCFFNQGLYQPSLEILKKTLAASRDKEFQQLISIDIAYAYLNLARYEEAEQVFSQFIVKFPDSQYASSVLLKLGALAEQGKDFVRAEQYYFRVIDEYPGHSISDEALNSLAHLYWEQDRLEEARDFFAKTGKSGNSRLAAQSRVYLAEVMAEQGETEQALKILDEVSVAGENSLAALALVKKGSILKEMREYEAAVQVFDKALEKGIDDVQIHFSLGHCLEKLGRDKDALQQYFKMVYLFDDVASKVKAYFRIARIYEKQDKTGEAESIYREIIGFKVEESKVAQEKINELKQ